jgi:hypothetical protein
MSKRKDEFWGSVLIIIGSCIVAGIIIAFALGFNPFGG